MRTFKLIILAAILAMVFSVPVRAATDGGIYEECIDNPFKIIFSNAVGPNSKDLLTLEVQVADESDVKLIKFILNSASSATKEILYSSTKYSGTCFGSEGDDDVYRLTCSAFVPGQAFNSTGPTNENISVSVNLSRVDVSWKSESKSLTGAMSMAEYVHLLSCLDGETADPVDPEIPDQDENYDSDNIPADVDNCPLEYNTDQADSDNDGFGDACDHCKFTANTDEDGDGEADYCADSDLDGDGVLDAADNCPSVANTDQANSDGDLKGDACDFVPSVITTGGGYTGTGGLSAAGGCTLSNAALPSSNGIAQAFILAFVAMGLAIGRITKK